MHGYMMQDYMFLFWAASVGGLAIVEETRVRTRWVRKPEGSYC